MGRKIRQGVRARSIAQALSLPAPDKDLFVTSVASLSDATSGSLCFAKNAEWAAKAPQDCLLIVSEQDQPIDGTAVIISSTPRLDFARALVFLEREAGFVWRDSDPIVHPSARIGKNVVLGRGVTIGANTVIYHNVVVGDEVSIGSDCVIKSGAVIGEEGFGFERDSHGRAVRLPHIGKVVIGNNVEIGSLTTVCRGTLADTVISDGAKIDDHVHIAHNVLVGEDAFVIACAEISGGVRIGKQAWVAPNTSVLNQLNIGEKSTIGLGAVVVRNVEAETVVVGNPARPLKR